jgi:hypothetical protein
MDFQFKRLFEPNTSSARRQTAVAKRHLLASNDCLKFK